MLVADDVQRAPVRVLLDSESQRSYITKKVADSLPLDGTSEVRSVCMLGGEASQTKRINRVSFSLTSVHESISKPVSMEALTIDKICTPLEPVDISLENYPHLQSLIRADSYPRGPVNVDILIGADFYFSFMSGKCKKGETTQAPTAVESTRGRIVGGPIEGIPCKNIQSMLCGLTKSWRASSRFGSWNLSELSIKGILICP